MLKRTLIFLIITLLILVPVTYADELPENEVVGEAALLMDYNSGEIIWSKDMNKKMYPASTTKILTAIIILENHQMDEVVEVPNTMPPHQAGSKNIGIDYGEIFTVEQLMYALLVESANDAAYVLALYHSGTLEAFALEMNEKAKELGATNSNFVNPNGLHDANHYTTAHDLGLIARYAFANPLFREMVSTVSYTIPPTNKQDEERNYIYTSNKFLYSSEKITYNGTSTKIKYDIVDGIKTGYTPQAGNCLVSTASKGNVRYLAVVLKSDGPNSLYSDSRRLLDYGFDNFYTKSIITRGAFVRSEKLANSKLTINLIAGDDLTLTLDKNIKPENILSDIALNETLTVPIEANKEVGTISYYYNGTLLGEVPLLTEYEVVDGSLVSTIEGGLIRRDENNHLDVKYYIGIFFKLLISFIIYRTIITLYNLKKRKRNSQLSGE
ncbi:MAG: D-alanyl-D-alanine carboxypeptidase [Clostridia bacterium]|nr:D-alanyl-D-alanine carboxypeptidase [Clostridia bacterium]